MKRIELIKNDITSLTVDAIVNAANTTLLGGGGVDGAIHRKAGSQLLNKCRTLNGCKTGEAKITSGYNLPSKFVIHTVGPVWNGGRNDEAYHLASCYTNSLKIAIENRIKTIAFPNISTGVYHFPKEMAAIIAVETVSNFLKKDSTIEHVIFCVFEDENFEIYRRLIQADSIIQHSI